MSDANVSVERDEHGVALVRLDRPKMNALSAELLGQLESAMGTLAEDPPGAVVVWGGERIFAAGADIGEFVDQPDPAATARRFHQALDAVADFPRAVIAAVNGYALGGGCELALACDLRVAGQGAKLGQPEVLLGIIPGGGGTQRLPRLVGPARAKDLILSGRQVDAEEALGMGLVDRVVPDAEVLATARAWAAQLAGGATLAQGLAKRAVDEGLTGALQDGLGLERRLFAEAFGTEDASIGIRSFLERGPGKADFVGR
ncbi:MAG TPA: enoyl-CoA hydratase-related protein [Acidimicrobiales bacterium]|nr:enoyl-CoA hydratase-related protein [Acidimicrobiales bacterium]